MPAVQGIGEMGEKIAADYLRKTGCKIIEKNYGGKFSSGLIGGEIDIIAKKNGVIHFVEVKSSAAKNPPAEDYFPPEARVNEAKEKRLIKTALLWLTRHRMPLDSKWQIDILSCVIDAETLKAKIRYFPNAIAARF
ncbi:MAG: hypothetical protein A2667_02410 [Candidatus Wildermuthbacteria bacterium RIFCSPHIGHO2_01_FULL_47_27]|uniref:UPF0102 protein A3A32_00280 n=2 Tax=Candidatus Wildermuthiibacteriota TaxID=1817923 RepID=A0A1G2RMS2_9BACT|nr:MAG: hypothetical protein UY15_C0005G0037 [Parcubacteria group bacterium GW2011_GWA2_47_9]OHA63581.1 MAG: hypothetical protein A2667_02410 [Candidatus Wildermuthbacteria bacterium RIFCSPHIGHO2_01_FULL_47_27]OHA74117.1 MAG: hypothetical protein A3A32_00280 [Candidatus Wildermuthbacteria bacterium RIFCSPLOWO2_01_FULL_48_35]OHA76627.1 MAG: hypothetical protein A3I38_00575 [Candidatus Wildermuthbacteria bacterium RIFCSPLOWO2_02_FULL_47_10]